MPRKKSKTSCEKTKKLFFSVEGHFCHLVRNFVHRWRLGGVQVRDEREVHSMPTRADDDALVSTAKIVK